MNNFTDELKKLLPLTENKNPYPARRNNAIIALKAKDFARRAFYKASLDGATPAVRRLMYARAFSRAAEEETRKALDRAFQKLIADGGTGGRMPPLRSAASAAEIIERELLKAAPAIARAFEDIYEIIAGEAAQSTRGDSPLVKTPHKRVRLRDLRGNRCGSLCRSREKAADDFQDAIARLSVMWVKEHYEGIAEEVKPLLSELFAGEPLTTEEFAQGLARMFDRFEVQDARYWYKFADYATTQVKNLAMVEELSSAEADGAKVMAVIDDKTTAICRAMDGRVIPTAPISLRAVLSGGCPKAERNGAPFNGADFSSAFTQSGEHKARAKNRPIAHLKLQ